MRTLTLSLLALALWSGLAASVSAQGAVLYSTDFTTLGGWTVVPGCAGPPFVWAADATPASHPGGPFRSPPASLNFNDGTDIGGGEYPGGQPGPQTCGRVTSPVIDLALASSAPHLRFFASWDCETTCTYDRLDVEVLPAAGGPALLTRQCLNSYDGPPWVPFDLLLDPSFGLVRISFSFDTMDPFFNTGSGVFIDDLEVICEPPPGSSIVCVGNGHGTTCPCNNAGASDEGCANSTGAGARMLASGSASVAADDLVLSTTQLRANQFGTYLQGNVALNGGDGFIFGDGLRCAGENVVRLQQVLSSGSGSSATSIDIALRGGVLPGDTRTYQLWYRDPSLSPCGSHFNLSNGIELLWLP